MTTLNADFAMPSHFPTNVVSRIASAVRGAYARSQVRQGFRQLLECDDLLSDIGVTRDDILKALHGR